LPVYITPAGMQRLFEEYNDLLKSERPRITAEVAYAASLGDRSENAEYQYGKKRLREIDKRLRFLQKRLEALQVVDPSDFEGPVIRFGATVTVEDEDGSEHTYRIVGRDELNPKVGDISYDSPIGRALIGAREGEDVVVRTPGGGRELVVVAVAYPSKG
jgi:transcription elongation factor GreB